MPRPRMRPSFKVEASCGSEQLMDAFRRHLVLDAEDVDGDFSTRNGVLRIPEAKRRFWTPYLELTIEECGDAETEACDVRTKLWGTFSPRPEIWTGFVFAIGTLTVLSIFSSVWGVAQLALGHGTFAFLVPLAALVVGALLYVSALVGQGLSISEMYRLRAFVDDCLREAENGTAPTLRTSRESSQL
jgi:hypothetical protein